MGGSRSLLPCHASMPSPMRPLSTAAVGLDIPARSASPRVVTLPSALTCSMAICVFLGSWSGDVDELVRRVINGDYGNDDTRKQKLGGLYSTAQKRVNEILA